MVWLNYMERIKEEAYYANQLIVSDLDGTLLTEKKVISDYTKEALMYAIEKGCHFIPATGRALGAVPKEVLHFQEWICDHFQWSGSLFCI